jgi:pimeloyl-ACP methyl ester carboxylesterase
MIDGALVTFVQRGDMRLRVFYAGEGPLVLLLHGFPELAYSWRHQFGPLVAAGYTVAAPDQRGFGGSSSPSAIEDFSLEELAADAGAVIALRGEPAAPIPIASFTVKVHARSGGSAKPTGRQAFRDRP